jgi:hypothetical protein
MIVVFVGEFRLDDFTRTNRVFCFYIAVSVVFVDDLISGINVTLVAVRALFRDSLTLEIVVESGEFVV